MSSATQSLTPDTLAPLLADFLQRSFQPQVRSVRIENLWLLTGGASRQTWSFDALAEQADTGVVTLPLILRCDPPGGPQAVMSRALEFHTLEAAYAEGVLVPQPYVLGDDSLGVPFFIMERIEGETIPRRLFRDKEYSQARQVMAKQLGACLARIHRVPVEKYLLEGLPAPQAGNSPAEEEISRFEEMYQTMAREPHPAFELAFRWLRHAIRRRTEELCLRIRQGEADAGSYRTQVMAHVRETVREKLLVNNPGWIERPES